MTAKEYLKQIQLLDIRIQRLELEREQLLYRAGGLKGIDYAAEKVSGTPDPDKMLVLVDKANKIERRIAKLTGKYMAMRDKIVKQIMSLDDPRYVEILSLRYLDHRRLEEISCIMRKNNGGDYSYEYTVRLHGYALAAFEKKFKNVM